MAVKNKLAENLKDAGCDEKTIELCSCEYEKGNVQDAEKLLMCQRKQLLDNIHSEQKRLDCLDYLVFMMKRQSKKGLQNERNKK